MPCAFPQAVRPTAFAESSWPLWCSLAKPFVRSPSGLLLQALEHWHLLLLDALELGSASSLESLKQIHSFQDLPTDQLLWANPRPLWLQWHPHVCRRKSASKPRSVAALRQQRRSHHRHLCTHAGISAPLRCVCVAPWSAESFLLQFFEAANSFQMRMVQADAHERKRHAPSSCVSFTQNTKSS